MEKHKHFVASLLVVSFAFMSSAQDSVDALRLNHIQVIGSHNSYKQAIEPALLRLIEERAPEQATALDYHHPTLSRQLTLGLRKLELDVFHDPDGGRYQAPAGIERLRAAGYMPQPFDPRGVMAEPGFKVLHAQDVDFRTSCLTLASCLAELLDWSEQNPHHLPVAVSFNTKDAPLGDPGYVVPLPFTSDVMDDLDRAILEAIPREKIVTPDDVRADAATLEQAVLTRGWPTLGAVRGKFLFLLDQGGAKLAAYLDGRPSLAGRVMFANVREGDPAAAFLVINDPINDAERIRRAVAKGYLVRTRADANTIEARSNDTSRRDAAFASGAHFISTDYYDALQGYSNDYRVVFAEATMARCNEPVVGRACTLDP